MSHHLSQHLSHHLRPHHPVHLVTLCALAALAGGCATPAGPLSLSLNELGSEVREDAGSLFGGLSHRRSHNVTGLGASDTVGMLSSDPDPPLLFHWPSLFSRPNLPDQLALRIDTQCSKVLVRDFSAEASVTTADVLGMRNALQEADITTFRLFRFQAELLLVLDIVKGLTATTVPASPVAATTATTTSTTTTSSATTAVAAPAATTSATTAAAMSAVPSATTSAATSAAATATSTAVVASSSAAGATTPAVATTASTDAERSAADLKVKAALDGAVGAWLELTGNAQPLDDLDAWKARAAALAKLVETARRVRLDAEEALRQARLKPGIVVARWEYTASSQSGVDAAGVSADSKRSQQRTGFVVLGQPRTLTLVAGDDLAVRACLAKGSSCAGIDPNMPRRSGVDSLFSPGRLYTTSFQLMAKHLAWSEAGLFSEQTAFGLKLKKLLETLSGASGSLTGALKALDIEFRTSQDMRASVANMGAISGGSETERPFTFYNDAQYSRSLSALRDYNNGYLQVSSMRSTLDHHATKSGATVPQNVNTCTDQTRAALDRLQPDTLPRQLADTR